MSNTLTMALDLATAHRFDRIQYELGPLPWEQHIEDSGADLDPISEDYEPVSAWVALGPVESALYDGPCWLWARGLDIDHDAQRRREREAKATASRERTEAVAYLVANALEAHRREIEPIEPSDRRFRETRAAVLRAQDTGASVRDLVERGLYASELRVFCRMFTGRKVSLAANKYAISRLVVRHAESLLDEEEPTSPAETPQAQTSPTGAPPPRRMED